MRLFVLAGLVVTAACGRLHIDEVPNDARGDVLLGDPSPETIMVSASTTAFDLFVAVGSPEGPVAITVTIESGVLVGATSPAVPAFTTGALPAGSTVTLINNGQIIGAGGAGGSGGNGGSGGLQPYPYCGRPGGAGGIAIQATVPMAITNNGLIAGGGGGGGGISACNETAGGGGGAGSTGGVGGAGATTLAMSQELAYCGQDNGYRSGPAGMPGSLMAGGAGGMSSATTRGGAGGGLGQPGAIGVSCTDGSEGGGPAGFAIKRGANAITGVADGTYATGSGPIRGPVGP